MTAAYGATPGSYYWKSFLRRHRGAVAVFAIGVALAFAWSVYVFLWFVGNAQSLGLVPATLVFWTMANLLGFIVYLVLWELLLVGVPVVIAAVGAWAWWKRLPAEERVGRFGRSRSAGGGGGISILFFLAFCVKVYLDGNWNVAISTFTLNYIANSMLTILEWGLLMVGIPAAVVLTWWVSRQ
jgi:hypothetical protein